MLFKLFQKRPQGYADLTPDEVHARLHSGKRVALIDDANVYNMTGGIVARPYGVKR